MGSLTDSLPSGVAAGWLLLPSALAPGFLPAWSPDAAKP